MLKPRWSYANIFRPPGLRRRAQTRLQRLHEHIRRSGPLEWPEHFVFIVTYGRTGSTLLQKLLNTIPGVYIAGENHDVVGGLFEAWRNASTLKHIFGWGHQAADNPWHGAMMADPDAFGQELAKAFVKHVLKPPRGTRIIGFKEVRYLKPDLTEQLEFMAKIFAPATFIINRRDPAAVARSKLWQGADKAELAGNIARFEAATAAFAAQRPSQCIALDYERWTSDPGQLRPMYDVLGARFDPAAVAKLMSVWLTHCS